MQAKKIVYYIARICNCNWRACKGVPFADLFLQFFNRIVINKTAVLNQVIFLILEKFAIFLLLNSLKYN